MPPAAGAFYASGGRGAAPDPAGGIIPPDPWSGGV